LTQLRLGYLWNIFNFVFNKVESRSTDHATFVFPYLPCAIFGPE
jgi:hypothetical protein